MLIKIRNSLFITIFIILLVSPMAGRLYAPLEQPYGQKPFSKIPDVRATLKSHSPKEFNAFTKFLFERAPLTKISISNKNKFIYNNFGYIDNDLIISGKDGWLFYKKQFNNGKCLKEKDIIKTANRMRVLKALSQTINIPIYFSISPNKSTIYPEKLSPRAYNLTHCVTQNANLLRETIISRVPDFIDHATPILAAKKNHQNKHDTDLYFHTDTHWNSIGMYYAMRQMAGALWRDDVKKHFPKPRLAPESEKKRTTDIANSILMVDPQDKFYNLKPEILKNLARKMGMYKDRFIIIHDSFYNTGKFITYFSKATLIGTNSPNFYQKLSKIEFSQKPKVIINFVERNFLARINELYDRTKIVENIIQSNLNLARNMCRYGPKQIVKGDRLGKTNMSVNPESKIFTPQNTDPWIVLNMPSPIAGKCIKLELSVQESGTLEIFLPPFARTADTPLWEAGRSFHIPVQKGANEIDIILPENLVGNTFRLDFNVKNTPIILNSTTLGT